MIATFFLAAALAAPHFDVRPDTALIDEPVAIAVRGLAPRSRVTIALRGGPWSSSATFVADADGVVDLTRTAPARGDYAGVDPMGLFWSAHRDSMSEIERGINAFHPPAEVWQLTAAVDGATIASASLTRRAVADNVAMSAVRERGLAGVLYTPPTLGKHPAVIVLAGSGGGLLPAGHIPGGLASRGYVVLSLACFGIEGLPPRLHDIPLEYFGTALEWRAAQPSVDPSRIAVLGISRGGELSLLLGSIFPQIRAVVAYVPSNVVVGGCCDRRGESSWTLAGRALAWTTPGVRDERAEIRVERIRGAVLLISGRDDRVWPSTEMANEVMARLDRNHFAYPHEHLAYDDAGHGIARPYTSTAEVNHVRHPLTGRILSLGGTPAGTAHAREDSWRHVLAFLEKNLAGAAVLAAHSSVEAVLRAQTQELVDAVAPGDVKVWDRYLDDRVIVTTEDGGVHTKSEMLKELRPMPEGVSGTIAVKDFGAVVHGNVAVTNYLVDENESYHGHALHCQYRTTDTWRKTDAGWRLIAEQVLALRTDPPSIHLSAALADEYVGKYALTPAITYQIRNNGGQLEGRRGEGKWEPLMAEAPDVLFVPGKPRYRKVFQRDAAQKITGFADRREAWDLVWTRLQ